LLLWLSSFILFSKKPLFSPATLCHGSLDHNNNNGLVVVFADVIEQARAKERLVALSVSQSVCHSSSYCSLPT
jgi:hypothetical protein